MHDYDDDEKSTKQNESTKIINKINLSCLCATFDIWYGEFMWCVYGFELKWAKKKSCKFTISKPVTHAHRHTVMKTQQKPLFSHVHKFLKEQCKALYDIQALLPLKQMLSHNIWKQKCINTENIDVNKAYGNNAWATKAKTLTLNLRWRTQI